MALAEKTSLMGSQFDTKQCREQFVTALSCFPQSTVGAIHWPSGLLSFCVCLLILTHMVVLILLGFPLFLKMVADIIAPKLRIIFCVLISSGDLFLSVDGQLI